MFEKALHPSNLAILASASALVLGLAAAPVKLDPTQLAPELNAAEAKNGNGKGGGNGGGSGNGGGNGGGGNSGGGNSADAGAAGGSDGTAPDGLDNGKGPNHTGRGTERGIGHAKYGDGSRETDKVGRGNGFGHRRGGIQIDSDDDDTSDNDDVGGAGSVATSESDDDGIEAGNTNSDDLLGQLSTAFGPSGAWPSLDVGARPKPMIFVAYFGFDKDNLDQAAMAVIEDAEATARKASEFRIYVVGNADRAGPASYNVGLANRRAAAVAQALSDRGLPTKVIATKGFGETRPLIKTADGVAHKFNRRVEILLFDDSSLPEKVTGITNAAAEVPAPQ